MGQSLLEMNQIVTKWFPKIKNLVDSFSELEIETKSGEKDLVTQVDKLVEKYIYKQINANFVGHEILGEETDSKDVDLTSKNLWVIDPIDGTANFVKQRKDYCVLVSYFAEGRPLLSYVYDVFNNRLYNAVKDCGAYCNGISLSIPNNTRLSESLISIDVPRLWNTDLLQKVMVEAFDHRYLGCSGLDGIRVIEGVYGGFINPQGGPWDFAPLILMAEEMGLKMTKLDGSILNLEGNSDFIIATEAVHSSLVEK